MFHVWPVLAMGAYLSCGPAHVSLEFQGLTGAPVITMEGRSKMAPFPASAGVPVLAADPAAGVSMTQAARDALLKLQNLLAENSEPLHNTLANLNTFSAALARNSDRLDGIITGVERLTGTGQLRLFGARVLTGSPRSPQMQEP